MNYSIGVDLGGTNLRVAAVDERGNLLEKVVLHVRSIDGRDAVIRNMCEVIESLVAKYSKTQLRGMGIGVPGIIDLRSGMLRESPNLPGWADYPVKMEIEKRLGTAVYLENDANAAALGEQWLGAARDVESMAMLTLGTGIGSALIFHGEIWHGMTGMAGEFGHMTLDREGPKCKCGNRGCLEEYASATAVVRMARELGPELSAEGVYERAKAGDEQARQIFQRVGQALGVAISTIINALNLPMHVIGGGVSGAWDLFSPAIFEELRWRSMVFRATESETIVTRAKLGSDAGIYGAARLPMIALNAPQPSL